MSAIRAQSASGLSMLSKFPRRSRPAVVHRPRKAGVHSKQPQIISRTALPRYSASPKIRRCWPDQFPGDYFASRSIRISVSPLVLTPSACRNPSSDFDRRTTW